jgi:hypothetical protein
VGWIDDVVRRQNEVGSQRDAGRGWSATGLDAHGPGAGGLDRVGELR